MARAQLSYTSLLAALVLVGAGCRRGSTQPEASAPLAPTTQPSERGTNTGTAATGGATRIKQVALGDAHSCVLMADQRVLCWGDNTLGQLGDHTKTSRSTPAVALVADELGSRNLMSLTAGGNRTCVVAGDTRERLCWGDVPGGVTRDTMPFPELANEPNSPQPLLRAELGPSWICGIRDQSEAVCRPDFERGKPTLVVKPTGYAAEMSLAVGKSHACATKSGVVECWGDNSHGQLGDGTRQSRTSGKPARALHIVDGERVLAGDHHSCVITKNHRELGCWGQNRFGQLGSPGAKDRASVVALAGLEPVADASAGGVHTCAVRSQKTGPEVHCWGRWDISEPCLAAAVEPTADAEYVDLAASSNLCFATRGGLVVCSGTRYNGPVTGRPPPRPGPFLVIPGVHGAVELDAGLDHVCARTSNGQVACWGDNKRGQLGVAGKKQSNDAVFPAVSEILQLAAGESHTCIRNKSGEVYCWGDNGWGQLGHTGTRFRAEPTRVEGLGPVVELSAGGDKTCVVEQSRAVKCWGYGPLGDGTEDSSPKPVGVRIKADIADLEVGDYHICGRTTAGALMCWGSNYMGELGLGNRRDRNLPTQVPGVRNPQSVMTAVYRTCTVDRNGGARCTGTNVSGQLGDGTRKTRTTLTPVRATTAPTAKLAGGIRYTCSLTTTGKAQCWGQVPGLGDVGLKAKPIPDPTVHISDYLATLKPAPTATQPVSCGEQPVTRAIDSGALARLPPNTAVELHSGRNHDCFIKNANELYCWGRNDRGQLGDGSQKFRAVPHQVPLK